MKILAFAASNSSTSINKQFVSHTVNHYFGNHEIKIPDLNDYEMPILSEDRQKQNGVPKPAYQFAELIDWADLIIISFAEHNGAYTVAFKNIFDWVSLIPKRSVFQDKPLLLISTSNGARGGSSVLAMAENRFPWNGGKVLNTFSLPKFSEHFNAVSGIIDNELRSKLEEKIKRVKAELNI